MIGTIMFLYKSHQENYQLEKETITKRTTQSNLINTEVPFNSLMEKLSNDPEAILIIDTRTLTEFEQGRIANAINIPPSQYERNKRNYKDLLSKYKDKEIIIYGRKKDCPDNDATKKILHMEGVRNIKELKGDYNQWEAHMKK
jgi:rhodanese-related sulfurtransferase